MKVKITADSRSDMAILEAGVANVEEWHREVVRANGDPQAPVLYVRHTLVIHEQITDEA